MAAEQSNAEINEIEEEVSVIMTPEAPNNNMNVKPSFTACYQWKLPEFNEHHVDHLTNGYIRDESKKYSLYVPRDVSNTCMQYYYNLNIINKVKTAENGQGFKSNLFSIGPFKFYMDVFPNGYDSESKGNIDWFLNLSSMSPTIQRIAFKYQVKIKENGHSYTNSARLNHDEVSVGWDEVSNKSIQELQSLTFLLFITIYDLFNYDDESIITQKRDLFTIKPIENILNQQELMENKEFYTRSNEGNDLIYTPHDTEFIDSQNINSALLPSGCGSWIVDDKLLMDSIKRCKNGERFESELFMANGFKWCLKMYPNGTGINDKGRVDLGIYLVTMSPNISKLWMQYRILLHETGTFREDTVGFARRAMGYLFMTTLSFDELCKLDKLTFTTEIMIFDVYNEKGGIIQIDEYQKMHNPLLENIINTATYQWNIDKKTILKIKECKPGDMVLSEFFGCFGFKWFLELYPKGQTVQQDDVNLYLTLLSMPPNLTSVALNFELILVEMDAKYGAFEQMGSQCMSYGWPTRILKRDDLNKLESMTFKVNIGLIDLYDKNGFAIRSTIRTENEQKVDEINGYGQEEMRMKENVGRNIIAPPLDLPKESYIWSIRELGFIHKIHNAGNAEYFPSDVFMLHGLKWTIQICPNGSSPVRKGFFNWYLHLASLPTNINKMYIFYRILLEETGSFYEYKTIFQCRQPGKGWGNDKLKHKDILDIDKFTFKLDIIIIDIFDNDGNNINNDYIKYTSDIIKDDEYKRKLKDDYVWEIDEKSMNEIKKMKNGQSVKSVKFDLCGFDWFFEIYPAGKGKDDNDEFKLYLNLGELNDRVSGLSCHFQLFVEETSTIYSDFAHFRADFLFDGWQSSRIKTEQIQDFTNLTIKVVLKIIDVYDDKGMPITCQYENIGKNNNNDNIDVLL